MSPISFHPAVFFTERQYRSHCLGREPKIKYFKMEEAASRTEQFRGVPEEFRNKKLRDLVKIIRRYDFTAYWYMCDMDAFSKTLARAYRKPFSDYYFWGYLQTILGIGYDLSNRGESKRADIIFDEQNIFGPVTKIWYPLIREAISDEDIRRVLPVEPVFKDDRNFLPLQAADMLAWMYNRSLLKPDENPFLWLWEQEFSQVKMSTGSQVVDQERMSLILESAYKNAMEGELLKALGLDDENEVWLPAELIRRPKKKK